MEQKRLDPKTDTTKLVNWYCDYKRLSLFLELAKGYNSPEEALKLGKAPAADWIQDLQSNPMVWLVEDGLIEIKLLQGVNQKYAEVFVFHPNPDKENELYMQAYGVCFHKLNVDQIIVNFLQVNTRLVNKTMIPDILTKDPDEGKEKENGTSTTETIQQTNNNSAGTTATTATAAKDLQPASKRDSSGRFIRKAASTN